MTGRLTLKSVVLFLPAAANSSHSLVVDLSRRREVVIVVGLLSPLMGLPGTSWDFPWDLMGLAPRLLGALESESLGHADSAFR